MGDGLDQGVARQRAKAVGGLAVSARRGSGGDWKTWSGGAVKPQ